MATRSGGRSLYQDCDCKPLLRIIAVVEVITVIVIVDIKVIGGVPVLRPVCGPRIQEQERSPLILETRITQIHDRRRLEAEVVLRAEVQIESVLRDVIAAVASALRP